MKESGTVIISALSLICSVISITITIKNNNKLIQQNLELSKYKESEWPTSFNIKNNNGDVMELFLNKYNSRGDEDRYIKIINNEGNIILDGTKEAISFKTKVSAINNIKNGDIEKIGKCEILN